MQINPNLSRAFVTRGGYYFETNKSDKAIKDYENALTLEPNNNYVLNSLWSLYTAEQNYTNALKTFKKIEKRIETKDDTLRVYKIYRFYYALLDDYKTEQFYLDKIAEIQSGFLNTQVWLYTRTQQHEKSIDHIKKYWP